MRKNFYSELGGCSAMGGKGADEPAGRREVGKSKKPLC